MQPTASRAPRPARLSLREQAVGLARGHVHHEGAPLARRRDGSDRAHAGRLHCLACGVRPMGTSCEMTSLPCALTTLHGQVSDPACERGSHSSPPA